MLGGELEQPVQRLPGEATRGRVMAMLEHDELAARIAAREQAVCVHLEGRDVAGIAPERVEQVGVVRHGPR